MARRPRVFAPGILYHVIVRGNQRQRTFTSQSDHQAYLERLAKYRKRYGFTIHAFCLMANHVHLLVQSSGIPLAKFMQGLQQSYTQYFNLRHKKTGHLFEGRYKAIVCQEDPYLLELIRYIHLNPVRAGMVAKAEQYPYSGHHAYLSGKATEIVDPTGVLQVLGGIGGYRTFVNDGVKDGHKEEFYDVEDQRFLGDEKFTESVRGEQEEEQPKPKGTKGMDAAARKLSASLGVEPARLRQPGRTREASTARTQIAYVLVRRLGYRLNDVARYFGRDPATLTTLLARFETQVAMVPDKKRGVERLTRIVML
jgi:putative transposase